jgi:hypothetical protein
MVLPLVYVGVVWVRAPWMLVLLIPLVLLYVCPSERCSQPREATLLGLISPPGKRRCHPDVPRSARSSMCAHRSPRALASMRTHVGRTQGRAISGLVMHRIAGNMP